MSYNPKFKPENFFEFAENIFKNEDLKDSEATHRTVINRCYLCTVLKAEQVLKPLVPEFPKGAEFYKEVERALGWRGAGKAQYKLGTLRKWRKTADYNLETAISKTKADFAISTAKDTLKLLEEEVK